MWMPTVLPRGKYAIRKPPSSARAALMVLAVKAVEGMVAFVRRLHVKEGFGLVLHRDLRDL
jgi:hypothetical protein